MCLGSIVPENRVLELGQIEVCSKECVVEKVIPEEELCGEVGMDGVRRFKHRRVLCAGSEVLVDGWLAFVESVNMQKETVTIKYPASSAPTEVPLSAVRSILTNPVNRDLQLTISNVYNSITSFAFELRRCLSTCPMVPAY
eukprot:TRINITY_DN23131_c0_g1_i1.p1 TRINITY_DN23131_c0_g1~~TRINITY_DN23131_c0_g1_i1.p1  ORF type:complete len:141 (+),score=34.05 TRINITY_DN23131_c0_g1_i1:74-496(+)